MIETTTAAANFKDGRSCTLICVLKKITAEGQASLYVRTSIPLRQNQHPSVRTSTPLCQNQHPSTSEPAPWLSDREPRLLSSELIKKDTSTNGPESFSKAFFFNVRKHAERQHSRASSYVLLVLPHVLPLQFNMSNDAIFFVSIGGIIDWRLKRDSGKSCFLDGRPHWERRE